MGGLLDEHWDTFIIMFYWRDPNSSFYIPKVWNGEPQCSLYMYQLLYWVYFIPMFFTEVPSNSGNAALVSMRTVTQLSPTKISALFTLQIDLLLHLASDIWDFHWLGVGTITGAGSAFSLGVQESSVVAPLLEFKGLVFWVLEHSCCMCPQPRKL